MKTMATLAALLVAGSTVSAQVLYDNGPLITHPAGMTGTVAGADRSAISPTGNLFGFGAQQTSNNRMADDFVNDPSWTITGLHLYAYQTSSAALTAPTITGVTLQIWDGGGPGLGNIVFGDTTTNVLSGAFLTDIYRTTATDTASISRRIQRVEISLPNLQLGAGTFWLDWSFSGSLASGPWQPPVSDPNTMVLGNGLQSLNNGAFNPALDGTFQQALPFTVIGVPTPGSLAVLGLGALVAARRRR